jgi:Mrp family chromosome partitioning ATPase
MDRIREAVSKARVSQSVPKPGSAARPQPAARPGAAPTSPVARFAREIAPEGPAFQEVKCNFAHFGAHRIISNEQDPVLNSYRVLRTRVLQKMEAEGWKTLAIVSPNSGAGKTVTAINLAIAIGSKKGSRAMLVDLDFYRPSVARYLGIAEPPSVVDFFEGTKSLRDVTVRPDLPDMLLVLNERVSRHGAEHLTSAKADELIEKAAGEFAARVVIFDMSPLLGCDDTIAFLPKVDCALMVAASGGTRVQELKEAQRLVGKTRLIGTVLNKAPRAMPGQSGDYYYY